MSEEQSIHNRRGEEPLVGALLGYQGRQASGWTARASYEFAGARAQLFREALAEYPNARRDDFALMRQHLDPRTGEHVLGFGEGSGHFCRAIADAIGPTGKYVITEPSPELLCNLPEALLALPQVFTEVVSVEQLHFEAESFDKVWACGAFHHCPDQTRAIAALRNTLKTGGRMVIFDIFHGTPMARHFDSFVARYCATGHEVKFMSEEFARSLCFLAGFEDSQVRIVEVPHRLCFASERDMGKFIYKLHALTRLPGTEEEKFEATAKSLKDYLPVEREGSQHVLHFDQRALIAVK